MFNFLHTLLIKTDSILDVTFVLFLFFLRYKYIDDLKLENKQKSQYCWEESISCRKIKHDINTYKYENIISNIDHQIDMDL